MKQEFSASRQHLTTVFPVASPPPPLPPPPPLATTAPVIVPLSPQLLSSEIADEEEEDDDDMDDTSSLEEQASSHSGYSSSSSRTAPAGGQGPQAMFLNFTSNLEPHTKPSNRTKKSPAFRVNGVNILNRKNVDSKTAIERMQRRRENHNHVERRRRDNINNTILELSRIIPTAGPDHQKLNKGSVLKLALNYILDLQKENQKLRETNQRLGRATDEARTDLLTHPDISPSHDTSANLPEPSHGDPSAATTGCVLFSSADTSQHCLSSTSLQHPQHPVSSQAHPSFLP
ncbi:hypothetical protein BX666DRAFT_1896604 [Dichotomocladium elegans]|nr:hypothetical protein BX666DRAFT_1896604 [Dichotomocladium elegans]